MINTTTKNSKEISTKNKSTTQSQLFWHEILFKVMILMRHCIEEMIHEITPGMI